jgi:hypothetical protein
MHIISIYIQTACRHFPLPRGKNHGAELPSQEMAEFMGTLRRLTYCYGRLTVGKIRANQGTARNSKY